MIRRFLIIPTCAALLFSVAGCSSEPAVRDVVEQPGQDITEGNIADPTADNGSLKAASAACLAGEKISGRPARIVSTVAPITNLISLVVGDNSPVVTGIVPEGTNSHTFEPPPSAAATLEKADIIFVNGLALEDPTLAMAEANAPNAVVCELGTSILPSAGYQYDFSFPKAGGKPNPHLWTSPQLVLNYLTMIRDVLIKADPENFMSYDENYALVSEMVMQLDSAMFTATESIPANERKLLTYHDAYAYFGLHFKYDIIGAIQPQSFEEPSPQDIAAFIDQVKSQKVKAIFGSEVFPSSVLEQIGKETNVRYVDTLRDDDLPGKPGEAEHSWGGLMKFNFITMVEALGGDASAIKSVNIDTGLADKASYPQ